MVMSPKSSAARKGAQLYSRLLSKAGGAVLDITCAQPGTDPQIALYQAPPYDLQVPSLTVARLSINLASVPVYGGLRGMSARDYGGQRYSLFLTPAQADARWRKRRASRHINIYFDPRCQAWEDDTRGLPLGQEPLMDIRRSGLRAWIDALELSMTCPDPIAEQASIGLARLILATLARRRDEPMPRLSPKAMAVVRDYVSAHLDGVIRVADMAAAVGLTPNRFSLAFTATAGRPPHRYVLECRLAQAMALLKHSTMALVEVAAACGFSSQQHLTTAMRHLLGTTPGHVRRSRDNA